MPKNVNYGAVFFAVAVMCLSGMAQTPVSMRYFFDGSQQLFRTLDSAGTLIEYIYDASGNIIQINRSTVALGALSILNITPLRGPAGTILRIFGQGFSAIAAGDLVQINGVTAVVVSATATELDVLVPAGVNSGQITVTVNGVTVSSGANLVFTAASAPVITSITPDGGIAGIVLPNVVVTGTDLTGASFTFPAGAVATAVSVGDTSATLRVFPITGRQIVPLVATTTAGSSTSSVTSGNHFIVLISPDEANTQAISILNTAGPPTGITDPTAISNQAMSAVVSLLNTSTPSAGGVDPTNISNQAMSPVVSLLNQSPSVSGVPDATNVSNEADSYLISLLNSTTAHAVRNPLANFTGSSVQAASDGGVAASTLSISSSVDSAGLIAGQQLSLAVTPPANTDHVSLSASNSVLQRVDRAPYAFTFNVPESGETLDIIASAQSVNNTDLAASNWVQKIGPDMGTLVRGRVVDNTGLPIAGAKVTVRAFGVFAEYYKVDSASGAGTDIKLLKVSVKRLESGIKWLNPNGVFGADPIGTGFEKYLAHFKAELVVENEGLYAFAIDSSGPAQLSLDGKVVDGPVRLAAGSHPLELSYLKSSDTASLQLLWTPPGGRQSAIPVGDLIAEDSSLVSISITDGEFAISRVPSKVEEVAVRVQLPDGRVIDSTWRPPVSGAATDFGDIVVPNQPSKEQK